MKKLILLFILLITYSCGGPVLNYENNQDQIKITKEGVLLFNNSPYSGTLISNISSEDGTFSFEGELIDGRSDKDYDNVVNRNSFKFNQDFINYVGLVQLKINPVSSETINFKFSSNTAPYAEDVVGTPGPEGTIEIPSGEIIFNTDPIPPYRLKFEKIIEDSKINFKVNREDLKRDPLPFSPSYDNCEFYGKSDIELSNKMVIDSYSQGNTITYVFIDKEYNIKKTAVYEFDDNCRIKNKKIR